jgi:uncharacterized protein
MSRRTRFIAALMLLSPAGAMAQTNPASAQSAIEALLSATRPVVTLAVTESVEAAPDKATISTGVETRALSAKDAMAQNATKIDAIVAALLKSGIDRKDIQTSGINLNPQYDYNNRPSGEGPRFIGYQANNMLTVVVRKIDKAGELVDTMVGAGATNLNGPSFGITDATKLQELARAKAVVTAQGRAEFYAKAAGFKSARLLSISETGDVDRPIVVTGARIASAPMAPSTRIEPGQLSASITLNFRYMLER